MSLLRNKGGGTFEDVTRRQRPRRADRHRVGRLGRLRRRRPARPLRLRRIRRPGDDRHPASPTRETSAGSTTTRATARSWTSPPRPASRTSAGPRARPGATTMTTAGSTSSSRTWASPPGSTATRATALPRRRPLARDRRPASRLRLHVLGLRQRRPARPLRRRLGRQPRRVVASYRSASDRAREPRRDSTTTSARRVPRGQPRARARPADPGDVGQRRRHRQRRRPRPPPRHRLDEPLGPRPRPDATSTPAASSRT